MRGARAKRLDGLDGREPAIWGQAESLIAKKQPKSYHEAVALLVVLRDLVVRKDGGDFQLRMEILRAEHARKPPLIARLNKAGLGIPTPVLRPPNAGRVPGWVQTVTGTGSLRKRQVLPAQTMRSERAEVGITRHPGAALGDGDRRVLGIGDELAAGTRRPAEIGDLAPMLARGSDDPAAGMSDQLVDDGEGRRQGRRERVDPGVGHDADEADGDQHAHGERLPPVHDVGQPAQVWLVHLLVRAMRVDEDVDVRHQHRSAAE